MLNDVSTLENTMPIEIPGYMTTEQAAKQLNVTPGRVRQLIKAKILPSEKLGNSNLVPVEAVKEYAKNRGKSGWPKGKPRNS
jgi:excisionase family DNA binding protein